MLAFEDHGTGTNALFFLHMLGASGREWATVGDLLQHRYRCILIDLPGFGSSHPATGYSVDEMACSVSEVIAHFAFPTWSLAAHSMGAKVAMAIARRAEYGDPAVTGLKTLALFAGSPPGPEPMAESRRETMKSWFRGSAEKSREEAEEFVTTNSGRPLNADARASLINDLLRMNRAAWVAWLDYGSREDLTAQIGALRTPALIVAGEADEDLGPYAQQSLMAPHFIDPQLETIIGAKHLLPMECAEDVARLIDQQCSLAHSSNRRPGSVGSPLVPRDYLALMNSDRVSAKTREALEERGRADEPHYIPKALTSQEFGILRVLLDHVIPQRGPSIDLAARIDARLSQENNDGWRYAALPADADAYRRGLSSLDHFAKPFGADRFEALSSDAREKLLSSIVAGSLSDNVSAVGTSNAQVNIEPLPASMLTGEQLRLWFEDVRGDAVKIYVSHPATLAAMGFSGIADGGNSENLPGFEPIGIGIGVVEAWEPAAQKGVSQ